MKRRLTEIAHGLIAEHVHAGDNVIDATMGNGHDTLFLARLVGEKGHVYAFDIQQQALDMTSARLGEQGLHDRVTLIRGSHARMGGQLPDGIAGGITAVVFNLGYLPGGEKCITTSAATTRNALAQSLELLSPGGIISLLVYVGHPGGMEENRAIIDWLEGLPGEMQWQRHNPRSAPLSPRLYSVVRTD